MQRSEIEAFLARHEDLFAVHNAAGLAAQHALEGVFESPAADASKGEPRLNRSTATGSTPFPT